MVRSFKTSNGETVYMMTYIFDSSINTKEIK
jgi:hypothetical protein